MRKALISLEERVYSKDLLIFSDNATTVAYLNKQGGTRSESLLSLTQQILSWAEIYVTSVRAVHQGVRKCAGGLFEQGEHQFQRLGTTSRHVPGGGAKMGSPHSGSFCLQSQQKTAGVPLSGESDRVLGTSLWLMPSLLFPSYP